MIVVWKDMWCEVVFNSVDSKNLNICVKNSYKIKYSDDIENLLKIICNNPAFSEFKIAGYKRTLSSMRREWEAHNLLYKFGIFKTRTGSTDLDNNESFIRKAGYAVLSFIYRLFNRRKKVKND